jgi:2-haloacid dehalogenase
MRPRPVVAFLDVNDTLSDLDLLRERFEYVGAQPQLLETWFASTLRDGIALAASGDYADFIEVGREVLRMLLSAETELRLPLDEAVDEIVSALPALPVRADVAPGLRRLRDTGVRVATLTNGSAANAEGLLGRAGLSELVDQDLDVSGARRWKPHPAPYAHACRVLDVSPRDAVLIAAHPWDIHGAKRAGMRGAWLNRRGGPYPDVFAAPDATAQDLPSLVDQLSSTDP